MSKPKAIYIKVSAEEHQRIKEEAVKRGMTMTKLILQSIVLYTERFRK